MESFVNEKLEELYQNHRKERKDLQGKIQALKKSTSKGDRKKKKEISEEITRLEAEISAKQQEEIQELKTKLQINSDSPSEIDDISSDLQSSSLNGQSNTQRISKAQKRRAKKVTQLKERELRILEQEISNLNGARHLETEELKKMLKEKNLMIQEIPSDGNCLYNALIHRIKELDDTSPTLMELRSKTANFLRANRVEFLPYLSHPDTGSMLSESQYEEYCNQVADTTAWGGEIELRALSHVLERPIEVIQAKGPIITVGDEYKNSTTVTLTYHRHMYGLGEHYNSVTPFKEEDTNEFS